MKHLNFIFLIALVSAISCKDDPSSVVDSTISATKLAEKSLPENTLEVLDFNTVAIQEDNNVLMLDISNINNPRIINEAIIPEGKGYYAIRHKRYLILEDRNGSYSQMIIDMENNRSIDLSEEGYTSGGVSISSVDHSILYRLQYMHPEINSYMAIIKFTSFDGGSIALLDSCTSPSWVPNRDWFLTSKFMYKEGYHIRREHALYDFNGNKIIVTREPYVFLFPRWNWDGSAFVYSKFGDCGIMLVEIDWERKTPKLIKKIVSYGFCDPLWSADGNYLVYVKWYDDGHTVFGNDILITDRNLILRKPIIEHDNIKESPLFWNRDDGLVTRIENKIYKYRIENLY